MTDHPVGRHPDIAAEADAGFDLPSHRLLDPLQETFVDLKADIGRNILDHQQNIEFGSELLMTAIA